MPTSDVAGIIWLENRDPAHWRDAWQNETSVGEYIISDKPTTAEGIRERATIVAPSRWRSSKAEKERRLIGERTKAALRAAKARGVVLGGHREQSDIKRPGG